MLSKIEVAFNPGDPALTLAAAGHQVPFKVADTEDEHWYTNQSSKSTLHCSNTLLPSSSPLVDESQFIMFVLLFFDLAFSTEFTALVVLRYPSCGRH